jgi:hypothetical protein
MAVADADEGRRRFFEDLREMFKTKLKGYFTEKKRAFDGLCNALAGLVIAGAVIYKGIVTLKLNTDTQLTNDTATPPDTPTPAQLDQSKTSEHTRMPKKSAHLDMLPPWHAVMMKNRAASPPRLPKP